MSEPEARPLGELTAAELVQVRELLAHCPDCRPGVRIGHLGDPARFVAMVEHAPSCPAVPEAMRAAGRTTMIVHEPLLVTLSLRRQEGGTDAT